MSRVIAIIADYWGWHHGDMGFGWWLVMFLVNIVFWAAVVYGIVWLVRGGLQHSTEHGPTAREILDRRLASGDISADEHDRLASRLSSSSRRDAPPPTPPGDRPAAG